MMNGVIVIDKPAGKTSHDVVLDVRRALGIKKAGHTGTLDPLATGVLPVCVNEATKLAGFLAGDKKEYRATMLLGVTTDTLDIEGNITGQSDKVVSGEEIRSVMMRMIGTINQVPPAYSAVKHCGKPLYKWARKGFSGFEAEGNQNFQPACGKYFFPSVEFRVAVQKDVYPVSLCGYREALGTGACLSGLRRLQTGFFQRRWR
jgi:tRNA pseudouridine55 synthase